MALDGRLACVVCALVAGCSNVAWQARFAPPASIARLDASAPFLKCHTADGHLYVLADWTHDAAERTVHGRGVLYDASRVEVTSGALTVPLADVALLETNRPREVTSWARVGVMAVVTVAQFVGVGLCIANPKACFGSCPTFYVDDGHEETLQAEGFSASIARVLEATDVDALWSAHARGRTLRIRMTNEALETHAVRRVRVLAAPRPEGGRVLRAGDDYFAARAFHAPASCIAPGGEDCRALTAAFDGREWRSFSDGKDLAAKDELELRFDGVPSGRPLGIVIGARNTLLNTFLLYQTLAYMGRTAGEWIARLERGGRDVIEAAGAPGRLLGDIDVSVWNGQSWQAAGAFSEVGPLAREVQLVRLPDGVAGDVRVRLRLNRANWRVDWIGLAELDGQVAPVPLDVERVERDGAEDRAALARLRGDEYLITQPGDRYTLEFTLPEGQQELFLETRGYYYEWMREPWLADENESEVWRMFADPAGAMRRLAPAFKAREREMEQVFWNSRIGAVH
jgi:hypothetical protein